MIRHAHSPVRLRFTRASYHRMGDAGIIPPDARVELLNGEIIEMGPIGPNHSSVVAQLDRFFHANLHDRAICFVQSPIALDEHSEPEPDLMLVKPRSDFYRSAHPTPEDVLLLIEVSDTTADFDLGDKLRLYTRAGIAEYWVFDLTRKKLIVHRDPSNQRYDSVQEYDKPDHVTPLAFADLTIDLTKLLAQ